MYGVVKFVGLADTRGSDHIHSLRYRVWVHRTVRIIVGRGTHAERECSWRGSETTSLVWTKAILTCQDYREAPTRSRKLRAKCRRRHTEGDEASDGIGADGYSTRRSTMSVNVPLSEPLHFQEPTPGGIRCNCVIALGERGCRGGIG